MEKNMETVGIIGIILGLYWGYVASNAIGTIGYILG